MQAMRPRSSLRVCALGLAAAIMLGGCASQPRAPDEGHYDPFEPVNRAIFSFNMTFDRAITRPIARGYEYVTPRPVKSGISNLLDNLNTPVWALNHFLQGELGKGSRQLGRFVVNSTVGLLGLLDPAADLSWTKERADFQQTFGKWGMPAGPYLMLPFAGPSNARGLVALGARVQTDFVWNYFDDRRSIRDKLLIMEIIETRRRLLPFDRIVDQAPDPYILVREAYRQRVEFEIRGMSDDDIGLDFGDEDWDDEEDEP